MLELAYGQFQSTTYSGALAETLPLLSRWIAFPLVAYVACSYVAEQGRWRFGAVAVFALAFAIMSPMFTVMGAYGPAHVAAEVGILAWPLFFIMIVGKAIAEWVNSLSVSEPVESADAQ